MLNSLEDFLYKHGAYWAVALIAVTLSKLYTDEEQSMRSIIRSTLMALVVSYMGEVIGETKVDSGLLFVYVFVGSFLIDVLAGALVAARRKLLDNPEILLKWFMRGRGK